MEKKANIDIEIVERCKNFDAKYKKVLKLIQKFDHIAIFRHVKPDYDALGSQLAMATWIKDNFKNKDVKCLGADHFSLTPKCFPYMDEVSDEWFNEPFLAIILDTSNQDRISDERFEKATKIVKIDHHPDVEHFGDVSIVDPSQAAAGELLANMLIKFEDYKISKKTAEYLYKAIVGDSNRFLYSDVNAHTFAVAKYLINKGININHIYKQIYNEEISSLEFTKWALENFKVSEHGVAYYIIDEKTIKKLKILPEQGKDCLYLFDHFNSIKIWTSITYDKDKNVYRVSIRSAGISIDEVASKYRGGGHAQASGAKLKSLDEVPNLIKDLDALIK